LGQLLAKNHRQIVKHSHGANRHVDSFK
jgi:hypothetical protein